MHILLTAQRRELQEESYIQVSEPHKVEKVKTKRNKHAYGLHKLCALLISGAFILGILLLVEHAFVITEGYKIIAINKDIDALKASNGRLESKIGQLKSLRRVEYLAKAQLGMVKADEQSTEFMDIGQNTLSIQTAMKTTAQPLPGKSINPLVDAINNVVKDWFSQTPIVQINPEG